jgi:hypothetical protein
MLIYLFRLSWFLFYLRLIALYDLPITAEKVGKSQGSGGAKFVVPCILIGVKW